MAVPKDLLLEAEWFTIYFRLTEWFLTIVFHDYMMMIYVISNFTKCRAWSELSPSSGVEPEPFKLGEHLVEASGKLLLLDGLLRHLKSTGHKVLLFSQMTSHLDIVQDYMTLRSEESLACFSLNECWLSL